MSSTSLGTPMNESKWLSKGLIWFALATVGAGVFFADGVEALLLAWSLPEYSHGPLIPILSGLLFIRQLRDMPIDQRPKRNRWVGVLVVAAALLLATLGRLSNISDLVAYAIILWVGGILLVSFGWSTGKHFWPPVLHLVYMLPLPGVIYYKMTTWLQLTSSEIGVFFLKIISIPVFLDGNIIDLGITKLHVAEACSGLRYLFPILSFSYIFAVLYKGPMWHKAVLLISAAPITVLMNSVRITIAGIIVQHWGLSWLDGFTHFFEGWVIFLACILLLFALARIMLSLQSEKKTLAVALDLDMDGLGAQAARLRSVRSSGAMVTVAVLMMAAAIGWQVIPERETSAAVRDSFALFPRRIDEWDQVGTKRMLSKDVVRTLGADDYHSITLRRQNTEHSVELFTAWYADQSKGGVHSPEICLPGGGWEIAWLERRDLAATIGWKEPFKINRAIIQKEETRMLVYYWFEQRGRKIAWDIAAKYWLLVDGIRTGRTDGAIVRLTTVIAPDEDIAKAESRLNSVLIGASRHLDRFM